MTTFGGQPVAAMVELQGVHVGYRGRDVLGAVNLRIERGERVGLIGPNGAGKSTLLRCVAGLARPHVGSVRLDGHDVGRLERREIARRLAVVPQLASLPFAARVEELVALGRLPHEGGLRGHGGADRTAVDAAIERVGLAHLRGRDARELSLGERQLVLVALAVAQEAPLLVLDEPTIHLDLRHQVRVMELIVDLNERDGTTVIAVLHDLRLAGHFFDRLVMLGGGRVVADGPPEEVLDAALVREVFRVDPSLAGLPAYGREEPAAALPGR